MTAAGYGINEIMRRAGVAKTAVRRRQERFMQAGADGLLRDKTRPSRIPPLGQDVTARVVALMVTEPPGETTHWTAAAMAKACTVSVSAVQRIWRSHGLRPHQVRRFKLSNGPSRKRCAFRRVRRQAARRRTERFAGHRRPLRGTPGPCRRAVG